MEDTPVTTAPPVDDALCAEAPVVKEPLDEAPVEDPVSEEVPVLESPVPAEFICPRCGGDAPFMTPRSLLDKVIGKIIHMRRCDLCGYRFIVVRYQGNKSTSR